MRKSRNVYLTEIDCKDFGFEQVTVLWKYGYWNSTDSWDKYNISNWQYSSNGI
jgi:hypothetical protein